MKRTGVPAAVTLAQGLLETENGNSELVKKSNNHFGIKCKNTWTGASVRHDDDALGECFRAYTTPEESYKDHSDFLHNNTRYSGLFKLDVKDYKGWAYGLKRAGYATNPRYPEILINNIEQYNLQQYTLLALEGDVLTDTAALKNEVVSSPPAEVKIVPGNNNHDSTATSIAAIPEKLLLINNCKCIAVKKGVSLLAIATKYNIPLARLLEYNDLSRDGLLAEDQFIFLQKKSRTSDLEFYTVQKGETLYTIAQKNGIILQCLAEYNGLEVIDVLAAGSRLYLKPGMKEPVEEKKLNNGPHIYVVKRKDGLYAIATKYHVTVKQLRKWNKLRDDALIPGQHLIISK